MPVYEMTMYFSFVTLLRHNSTLQSSCRSFSGPENRSSCTSHVKNALFILGSRSCTDVLIMWPIIHLSCHKDATFKCPLVRCRVLDYRFYCSMFQAEGDWYISWVPSWKIASMCLLLSLIMSKSHQNSQTWLYSLTTNMCPAWFWFIPPSNTTRKECLSMFQGIAWNTNPP